MNNELDMKPSELVFSAVMAIVICAVLFFLSGCAYTRFSHPSGFSGSRLAILYPFELEDLRYVDTNATVTVGHYRSEGANSNTVAIAEGVSRGVAEGIVKGLKAAGL